LLDIGEGCPTQPALAHPKILKLDIALFYQTGLEGNHANALRSSVRRCRQRGLRPNKQTRPDKITNSLSILRRLALREIAKAAVTKSQAYIRLTDEGVVIITPIVL
jgi:hypothetical protein